MKGFQDALALHGPQFPAVRQEKELAVGIALIIDVDADRVPRMGVIHLPAPDCLFAQSLATSILPLLLQQDNSALDNLFGVQAVGRKS